MIVLSSYHDVKNNITFWQNDVRNIYTSNAMTIPAALKKPCI